MISQTGQKVLRGCVRPFSQIRVAKLATRADKSIFQPKSYGGKHTVTLIPGDGIGNETSDAVKQVFKVAGAPIEWEQFNVSGFTSGDDSLLAEAVESLRRNKVGLKGILYTPIRLGHASFNVTMRKELDIYASVSVCKNIEGIQSRHEGINFAIIRENTEGEYSGLEHIPYPGVVESLKIITRANTERIARYAFDYALKNGRKRVTCIHKANIMKMGDGLFLNTCRKVAKEYTHTGIEFRDMIVDNTAMQLVANPQQFDVMVLPNLYGNIVSNVGAGLIGTPGTVAGANIGRKYAVFEPGCRHVAKDIQGSNIANPTAMILSAVLLLKHLNLDSTAELIESAVYKTIAQKACLTPDMGGKSKTSEFVDEICRNI